MDFAQHQNLVPSGSHVFTATYGTDKGLVIEFYMEPVHQVFQSEKEGRPIFKDVPYIHLFAPGNKSDVRREVKMVADSFGPSDPERFPRQWQAFQSQQEQPQEGTPLSEWPTVSKSQVLELKAMKISTVEQLASVTDSALQNIGMGGRVLRDKAIAWLDSAKGSNSEISKLVSENETLKADLEAMKQQLADLAARQEKRGPGRPRKDFDGDVNDS